MSREIKFRAWDSESSSYTVGEFLMSGRTKNEIHVLGVSIGKENECLNDEVILEQYTGLKDKNGKEIYEGNIFKDVLSDYVGVVKYGIYTHCFDDKRLIDFGAHVGFYVYFENQSLRKDLEYWARTESIGNIRQNPELLKVGNNG